MANDKLHQFIQAALTNPNHPVFRFRASNPILKHYAVNVRMGGQGLLETIAPEDWEKNYPQSMATMLEVMRLCEEDAKVAPVTEAAPDAAKTELERKLAETQATITARDAEIATLKAAPAAGTEGE